MNNYNNLNIDRENVRSALISKIAEVAQHLNSNPCPPIRLERKIIVKRRSSTHNDGNRNLIGTFTGD